MQKQNERIEGLQILRAIAPGVEDDFFPISLPATAESFAAHIARIFRIFIIPFSMVYYCGFSIYLNSFTDLYFA